MEFEKCVEKGVKMIKTARSIRPISRIIEGLSLDKHATFRRDDITAITDLFFCKQFSISHPWNNVFWTTSRMCPRVYGGSHRYYMDCDLEYNLISIKAKSVTPLSCRIEE